MQRTHKMAAFVTGLSVLLLIAPVHGANTNKSIHVTTGSETGSQSSVNGSISVDADAVINGSLSTVNGSIRVDENVTLKDAETVNGTIRIGSGSSAEDITSVNGSIRIGGNVALDGEIEVVNGRITLDDGATVEDDVSNVNGSISMTGAEIGGSLSTVNGDITLSDGTVVHGNLIVEKPGGWGSKNSNDRPRIVIGQNSKIGGDIVLEREVELFISESAEVGGVKGEMSMDDAVRFAGENP